MASSRDDFESFVCEIPQQLSKICEQCREQAVRFMQCLVSKQIEDRTLRPGQGGETDDGLDPIEPRKLTRTDSMLASWSDITLIYSFFKHFT